MTNFSLLPHLNCYVIENADGKYESYYTIMHR